MDPKLKNLFEPVKISGLEIKNRAVMPAMGTGYGGVDGQVTERLAKYLARRAQGGTGLIVTEVCAVDVRGKGFANEIGAWSDDQIESLKKIPDAIHPYGAKTALQLHHAGRETFEAFAGGPPEAPSSIPSAILNQPCVEMTVDRIKQLIDAYAKAAARAREAGFDAVEVHGAHGYLIGQFLSPFSNQRSDEYGGSDENRARFATEILEAVRAAVGDDFPVVIRVSADEVIRKGYDISFMKWLAPRLVDAGADAIHASVGVYSTPGNLSIAGMDTEPGFNLHRARAIKEIVDVPVIGVGRINDPRLADEAIARGDADMISFGRQHLTDPDFINKAKNGEFEKIRFCLACNQGCIERLSYEFKSATCSINADCGREYKPGPPPLDASKTVWVIGAGPAGLSAAMELRERGAGVVLFEKDDGPGGQLRPASKPPNKSAFADWVSWIASELAGRDVPVKNGTRVTAQMLESEKPDAVVLASGAHPLTPEIRGIDSANVCEARELLMGKIEPAKSAIILGAGYVGMETSDYLMARGIQVTLLEMSPFPPVGQHLVHGYWLHRRLRKSGGEIILGAVVTRIEPDAVFYLKDDEEVKLAPAPMVVNALGARPATELADTLEKTGIPYIVVGDAKAPRRLIEAVHEGAKAGKEILAD